MTRAEQRQQTRDRIVDAATDAFSERGFDGASTRDIAARAGVTQGLVTYHFSSKDEVWTAAADRIFGRLREAIQEATLEPTPTDPRERARASIRNYVRFVAGHPELLRFMIEVGKHDDDRMRWLVHTHLQPLYEGFTTMTSAMTSDHDPQLAPNIYYILAGASSLVFAVAPEARELTGIDATSSTAIDAHADLIARLLLP
jgi:AcrR family transcriptional regulator